jgi:myo-inositol-1(or 4)-monophosphatase
MDIIKILNQAMNIIYEKLEEILVLRNSYSLKKDGSPVSTGDLFIQNILTIFFLKSISGLEIISEENYNKKDLISSNKLIIIDPIDGTENFISGFPIWGVAISYWENQTHVASMIVLPQLGNSLITGSKIKYFNSRISGYSSSVNDQLLSLILPGKESRMFGCSVFNFYSVISGSLKTFENPKGAYVWDLIAGLNLALEHGCEVTVEGKIYNGQFLDPSRKHSFKVSNK